MSVGAVGAPAVLSPPPFFGVRSAQRWYGYLRSTTRHGLLRGDVTALLESSRLASSATSGGAHVALHDSRQGTGGISHPRHRGDVLHVFALHHMERCAALALRMTYYAKTSPRC